MSERFSERYGYKAEDVEIVIREDAPEDLRFAVAQIARDAGMSPSNIRDVICTVLLVAPNRGNWSEYPNIWEEVQDHLGHCEWFKVYDIAEALYRRLVTRYSDGTDGFRNALNVYFREKGIGWELSEEGITYRGSEPFSATTAEAKEVSSSAGRTKAASEVHEALRDLSRRPKPDKTGAIQHAIAALECTSRDVLKMPKPTLGELLPKLKLQEPLKTGVEKLWGFASERARHVREGEDIDDTEAELMVSVACALCVFLTKKDRSAEKSASWL